MTLDVVEETVENDGDVAEDEVERVLLAPSHHGEIQKCRAEHCKYTVDDVRTEFNGTKVGTYFVEVNVIFDRAETAQEKLKIAKT